MRIHLQHHAILVALREDGADLALAERVVKRVLDGLHRHAQPLRRVAIDLDIGLEPVILLVARDILQRVERLQPGKQAGRPVGELDRIGVHERVLELRAADPRADRDVLHRFHEDADAGDLLDLPVEPRDHRIDAGALAARLERDGELAGVGGGVDRAGAHEGGDAGDIGVVLHDRNDARLQFRHLGDGRALRGFDDGGDDAGVLLRQEALGDGDVEQHRADQGQHGDEQHAALVPQGPAQRVAVAAEHQREAALEHPREPAGVLPVDRAQQAPAHHRGEREGDDRGDHDRHRERDRELAEEAADHARHEQERDEHGDQRDRERDDGEADLSRAAIGGFERRHAVLDEAHHVLDHDDRVVHDEAGRDGERHEREVVEPVAQQRHDAERADERERQRDGRDDRRPDRAEEEEDHQHDETDGEQQRELHVAHRGADRVGAVAAPPPCGSRRESSFAAAAAPA